MNKVGKPFFLSKAVSIFIMSFDGCTKLLSTYITLTSLQWLEVFSLAKRLMSNGCDDDDDDDDDDDARSWFPRFWFSQSWVELSLCRSQFWKDNLQQKVFQTKMQTSVHFSSEFKKDTECICVYN